MPTTFTQTEIPVDPFILAETLDQIEQPDALDTHETWTMPHGPAELVTVRVAVQVRGRTVTVPVQRITSALPPCPTDRFPYAR